MSTLVVGDVHGCARELGRLLDLAAADDVVFLGDLFTKGPEPGEVFAIARQHRSVLGNHDQRLLDVIEGLRPDDRSGARTVGVLDRSAPGWQEWVRGLPLTLDVPGFTVVHAGLHPSGSLADTTREMALTMRRFPMHDPHAPFWYDLYHGDRRVVFGHDAARGLVRRERDGVPWVVGLDTGCVYGGRLSGYLVEDDRVVQVPAERVHRVPSSRGDADQLRVPPP